MSGPELHANAIATVLGGMPLRSAPPAAAFVAIIALGAVLPLAAMSLGALRVVAMAPLLASAYAVVAFALFERGIVVAVVAPLLATVVAAIATVLAGYVLVSHERRRIAAYNAILSARSPSGQRSGRPPSSRWSSASDTPSTSAIRRPAITSAA